MLLFLGVTAFDVDGFFSTAGGGEGSPLALPPTPLLPAPPLLRAPPRPPRLLLLGVVPLVLGPAVAILKNTERRWEWLMRLALPGQAKIAI